MEGHVAFMRQYEIRIQFWLEDIKRDHFGDYEYILITLKWIREKQRLKMCTELIWPSGEIWST
jgi:hypothetical protein